MEKIQLDVVFIWDYFSVTIETPTGFFNGDTQVDVEIITVRTVD